MLILFHDKCLFTYSLNKENQINLIKVISSIQIQEKQGWMLYLKSLPRNRKLHLQIIFSTYIV